MDGGRIALYDLAQIAKLADIDAIEDEMIHKVNTLKTQVPANPGLQPVLNLYLNHVNSRRNAIIKLIEYMSSLLISLNSITLPETGDASKLHSDQNVIMFELDRLKTILANITLK
jgi:hypothetical protein